MPNTPLDNLLLTSPAPTTAAAALGPAWSKTTDFGDVLHRAGHPLSTAEDNNSSSGSNSPYSSSNGSRSDDQQSSIAQSRTDRSESTFADSAASDRRSDEAERSSAQTETSRRSSSKTTKSDDRHGSDDDRHPSTSSQEASQTDNSHKPQKCSDDQTGDERPEADQGQLENDGAKGAAASACAKSNSPQGDGKIAVKGEVVDESIQTDGSAASQNNAPTQTESSTGIKVTGSNSAAGSLAKTSEGLTSDIPTVEKTSKGAATIDGTRAAVAKQGGAKTTLQNTADARATNQQAQTGADPVNQMPDGNSPCAPGAGNGQAIQASAAAHAINGTDESADQSRRRGIDSKMTAVQDANSVENSWTAPTDAAAALPPIALQAQPAKEISANEKRADDAQKVAGSTATPGPDSSKPVSLPGNSTGDASRTVAANAPGKLMSDDRAAAAFTNSQRTSANQVDQVRFVQRVARAFRAADEQGGEIRLRLSPPELGSLKIEVAIRNGVLTARLEAETSTARSLLLDNLPALRERLGEQNIKIEHFDVDLKQDGRGDGSANPPPNFAGSRQNSSRGQSVLNATSSIQPATGAIVGSGSSPTTNDGQINVVV